MVASPSPDYGEREARKGRGKAGRSVNSLGAPSRCAVAGRVLRQTDTAAVVPGPADAPPPPARGHETLPARSEATVRPAVIDALARPAHGATPDRRCTRTADRTDDREPNAHLDSLHGARRLEGKTFPCTCTTTL
ncbi:hypothetical protein GCM10019016_016650 [Streptomyces prasinosporus]|uniref:Uncharacterized protein n=1 Tax=Streptomyces prasinosporus TaxID=68256 RepID=A0ABP6TI95_9ACTN